MGIREKSTMRRLPLLLLICSAALVLGETERGLPGGLDKADAADPGQAREPLSAEVPTMAAPVNKNDENAAEMAIALSQQEEEANDADDVATNLKLRNAAAESMMGPLRTDERGDAREVSDIIAKAHANQKAARARVDMQADTKATQESTDEMNMALTAAGVEPLAPETETPAEAADAEIASTPGAKELETAIEATVPSVNSKSAPKVEISPEVQQETAAAEAEAAAPVMSDEQQQLVQSARAPPELPADATTTEKKEAALAYSMPHRAERRKQAAQMARAARNLKELRAQHAKQLKQDASSIAHQKSEASNAAQVASVLAQARALLDDSRQHLADVRAAIPDAEGAVEKARHAAAEEAADLETDLSKHSLAVAAIPMYRDEEDQQGQKLMDEKIVEKQQHAQEGLQEVARQRRQLSKDMRQAMDLVEKAARTSPGEAPRLGHLQTKVAKDHLQDMHNKHLEQQQALDEIQAKYQKAEDQLRSTQVQNMLYDAQLAGTLTSADMEELRHKMRLSAAADGAFEKSVALVHSLREEEHNAEVAIEAGFPTLEHVVASLKKIPQ